MAEDSNVSSSPHATIGRGTSSIEWTEKTWNPVTGCSKVSPGCDHCYAETLSLRFGWSKKPWLHENAAENVVLHPERLTKPKTWRKPSVVFVNSMSDLFHEEIPEHFVGQILRVMADCPQHTFQVLTKRPERALALLERWYSRYWSDVDVGRKPISTPWTSRDGAHWGVIPNLWLGVSIESWRYNWRADVLRKVPAPVRFVSAEPLLDTLYPSDHPERGIDLTGIDWVIVGGESGPVHRPMDEEWVREIQAVCEDESVAFFFKQWGGRTPKAGGRELYGRTWDEMPVIA